MVSDQTVTKNAKELMKLYRELHVKHTGQAPLINSYKDLWGFKSIYEDLVEISKTRPREVLEYYFELDKHNHSVIELFRNYDDYSQRIDDYNTDREERLRIRLETEKRVREWQAKNGSEHTGTAS